MTAVLKYRVQSGDSLSAIANAINRSEGVRWQTIETANGLADANLISVGQLLMIPYNDGSGSWNYEVQAGDSLSAIANAINGCAGVTWMAIATANPGLDPDLIHPGQLIVIPAQDVVDSTSGQTQSNATSDTPAVDAETIGYWDWTWSNSVALPGANIGIAFSGWADVDKAISDSARCQQGLSGRKYISLGGGSETTGAFSQAFLEQINSAIHAGRFAGYEGLAYDIETGDSGLAEAFATSFATAKAAGFEVLVTISHSSPYGIADGATLMQGFFGDSNIDYLSPQLYTSGQEAQNDYADPALSWSHYSTAKARIIPSLVSASYYPDAVEYFASQGVTLSGYIQWKQVG